MSGPSFRTDPDQWTGIQARAGSWHVASLAGWYWPAPFPAPWDPCKEGQWSLWGKVEGTH